MIFKIYKFIAQKISITFAIALFSTSGSWVASFYGFYFVYATVNFTEDELNILIVTQVIATIVAVFTHWCHYGLFHPFGFSGFSRSIKIINKYFKDDFNFTDKDFDKNEMEILFNAVVYLPKNNVFVAVFYTILTIVAIVVTGYYHSFDITKVIFIVMGGTFASVIIGYFTYNITEYFIGPYKGRIERIIFQQITDFRNKYLLSYKYKSFFTLLLIFFSMIILTILIRRSEKPIIQIMIFIFLSILTIGFLIFLSINTITISLANINKATKNLALGGSGLYYPIFSDKELMIFSHNYNNAAKEINEIRSDLEQKVMQRTEELKKAYDSLNGAYKQIQADLHLARRIQKNIMPENFSGIEGIKLYIHYNPMSDIGGDIYDVFELMPGYIRIFLADAIGHGVQAALVTMIIKGEYEKVKRYDDKSDILEILNNSFIDLYSSLNVFFSCIIIDININNYTIKYSSAGHPDQLHIHNNNLELIAHTGKLIGITKDTSYKVEIRNIEKNDKLLFFTDGLFEQINEKEEVYSEKKLRDLIEQNKDLHIQELQNCIISDLKNFMHNDNISANDDVTLICVEIENK